MQPAQKTQLIVLPVQEITDKLTPLSVPVSWDTLINLVLVIVSHVKKNAKLVSLIPQIV